MFSIRFRPFFKINDKGEVVVNLKACDEELVQLKCEVSLIEVHISTPQNRFIFFSSLLAFLSSPFSMISIIYFMCLYINIYVYIFILKPMDTSSIQCALNSHAQNAPYEHEDNPACARPRARNSVALAFSRRAWRPHPAPQRKLCYCYYHACIPSMCVCGCVCVCKS